MNFFHTKFSKVFFVCYCVLAAIFILQDITADRSFFDLSGLGLYILSYPLISILKIFVNINVDSKLVLYLLFTISSIVYLFIVDRISYSIKKAKINQNG